MWIGASLECRASSSLVDEKVGGLSRWSWREGGRGGGPLVPPNFGLGGRGGGDRRREGGGILDTADTVEFSMGIGGGGEKSGASMCKEVLDVSGMGTWQRDSSP